MPDYFRIHRGPVLRLIIYTAAGLLISLALSVNQPFAARCRGWSGNHHQCPHLNCGYNEYYNCLEAGRLNSTQNIFSKCKCVSAIPQDGYNPGGGSACATGKEKICDAYGGNCKCVEYRPPNGGGPGDPAECEEGCTLETQTAESGDPKFCRCPTGNPPTPTGPCSDIDEDGICDGLDSPPGSPGGGGGDGDSCGGCPSGWECEESSGLCIPEGGGGNPPNSGCDPDPNCTCVGGEEWCNEPGGGGGGPCPQGCILTGSGNCMCPPLPNYDGDDEPDEFDDDDDNDGMADGYDPNPLDPDTDNDGVIDGDDDEPNNSYDSDGDGTPDPVDKNPNNPNDGGGDLDGNGIPNSDDPDIDGDGIGNSGDDTPFGDGGSGGGSPGSGGGGIPDANDGPGSGGSGTGGNDPNNNDPPPDDPDQPDDISDLCEDTPSCDCVPRSFIFKGAVDYEGDCCLHYYKNLSNQMWCDCQAGDCDALASSGNDLINAAVIARQNYKAMGKNLTYAQLQNALNDHYYNLSRDQASRSNHLNQQQQSRADYLNQQQAARTDFLNDQQTTRTDWLNQQQHDRTAALDANQEARHKDLKQALQGLGNGGTDDLKDALIDPSATYSDTSTDNLQAHDFAALLDARATQFSDRFDQFFESVKTSDLFTLPFGLFDSLPAGGSSAMNITIGKWGGDLDNTVGFDFADYAAVFDVLRTLFLILSAYASFKILTVKHA